MPPERRSVQFRWFHTLLSFQDSVIPNIWKRVLLCGLVGLGVSEAYAQGLTGLAQPAIANVVPSLVLGLLLVFRTNTAYDRFWEGRKSWGRIVNASRNLARQLLVAIQAQTEPACQQQRGIMRLVVAFAVATKQHLRSEPLDPEELAGVLSPTQLDRLASLNHPALGVALWIDDYLQQQRRQGQLDPFQLNSLTGLVSELVDALGACERILKTPVPLAYSIHLKQLLLIYCLTLPFSLVEALGSLTAPVVALVSFTLFGIEGIGLEIENPFGRDRHDLPLDHICATIHRNIEALIQFGPSPDRSTAYPE